MKLDVNGVPLQVPATEIKVTEYLSLAKSVQGNVTLKVLDSDGDEVEDEIEFDRVEVGLLRTALDTAERLNWLSPAVEEV